MGKPQTSYIKYCPELPLLGLTVDFNRVDYEANDKDAAYVSSK